MSHLPTIIHDLAVILAVAAVVTIIFRAIRQPLVLGYIIAGVIIGPHTPPFPLVEDLPNIQALAELGVIFLMFSLGIEFSFRRLTRVGSTAVTTALVEVIGMLFVGYVAGRLLGWSETDSLFLGGMLSISSTTIILKAFEELGLSRRRFAETVFGVLIVEDLFAILLLVGLPILAASRGGLGPELFWASVRLVVVIGSWIIAGVFLIPHVFRYARRWMSDETLTVASLGLCLLLVVLAAKFGYSAALGAFIMGSILAETEEVHRIEELVRPIRDLFGAVFFVSVGMLVDPSILVTYWLELLLIAGVTVVGKIITSGLGALLSGQPLKTSLQIGFSLAQIGEFSFIIATLGTTLGLTSDTVYPIGVAVSVLTTFLTPYLIRLSEPFTNGVVARVPSRVTAMLDRYSAWAQQPRTSLTERFGSLGATLRVMQRLVKYVFRDKAGEPGEGLLRTLGPWDIHLVKVRVGAESALVARSLADANVRGTHGVNVVAIQRGERVIAPPAAQDILLPGDDLLALGTDEQIDRFQQVAAPKQLSAHHPDLSLYRLHNVRIEASDPLVGQTIRGAKLRETSRGLLVGLERGTSRQTNPDPATVLQAGDVLWMVME